jgi:hypothetical protein
MNSILNQKIANVVSIIPDGFPKNVQITKEAYIQLCLEKLGIYNDDLSLEILLSEDTKEGDARKVFCENNDPAYNLPIARFRRLWSILKEGSNPSSNKSDVSPDKNFTSLIETLKPVSQLSDRELLERYISGNDSETEKELKTRSHDRNFVVFSGKEQINIDMTLKMLRDARRREMPKTFNDGTETYILYKIGESPEQVFEICPVTGDILLDGYSDKIGVKWSIPLEGRQFAWIMKDQGIEMTALTIRDVQKTYQEAGAGKNATTEGDSHGIKALKAIYPKIGVIFHDLKITGDLPSLKSSNKKSKQDPFGKRY